MSGFNRRSFLRLAGAGMASATGLLSTAARARTVSIRSAHIVIIGGGFGGATCARYLKLDNPNLRVTLIEADRQYLTCPFSNNVLAGWRSLASLTQTYDALRRRGIEIVHGRVSAIDADKKQVRLPGRAPITYDSLVVAPGIELKWGAIRHYTDVAAAVMPHAWKAGAQTLELRKRLQAMKNGGVFLISVPAAPYRCPPGPYERASVVAHYLKQHKPRSKILILDAKDSFSKQGLFTEGWKKLYGDMIEWVPGSQGGTVVAVDTRRMRVEGEVEQYKGDVINIIPPQTAGRIALQAGLADASGWCPVDPLTFASTLRKNIYVIGDAANAGAMPKSGFAANSQAKIAALAILADLDGRRPAAATYVNTCYSFLAPEYAISVAGVYRTGADGIKEVPDSGGVSPKDAEDRVRAAEAHYANGWYASITADVWG